MGRTELLATLYCYSGSEGNVGGGGINIESNTNQFRINGAA
jgi:hypothetical protein